MLEYQQLYDETPLLSIAPSSLPTLSSLPSDILAYLTEHQQAAATQSTHAPKIPQHVTHISDADAIAAIRVYADRDASNLASYDNFVSALCVLAKAVQTGEITGRAAYQCADILAGDNEAWKAENARKIFAEIGVKHTTAYSFFTKFIKPYMPEPEPIEAASFAELVEHMEAVGKWWHLKHETVTKQGAVKTQKMATHTAAEMLQKHAHIRLIGDSADSALLCVYNPDTGIYVESEALIHRLIKSLEQDTDLRYWRKFGAGSNSTAAGRPTSAGCKWHI